MDEQSLIERPDAILPLADGDHFLVRQPAASGVKTRKISKTDLADELGSDDVEGPASATDSDFAQFDSTTGKLIKDGGLALDTDGSLAADSDDKIPSQKAVKNYVDTHAGGGGTVKSGVATLSSGAVVVSAPTVAADTVVVVTPTTAPSTAGTALYVDPADFVLATSFTIKSDDAADARDVFWMEVDPTPTPMVLFADATSADAYVTKDWGSDESETWLTFGIAFDSSALTFWNGDSGSGVLADMLDNIDGPKCMLNVAVIGADTWFFHGSPGSDTISSPAPTAGVWQDCEMHFLASGTCEFYIAGSLVGSFSDGGNTTRKVRMGQAGADPNAASLVYLRDVKVGTTRGGSELFADDFSGGDLSNWDSTTGACTVVPDPF